MNALALFTVRPSVVVNSFIPKLPGQVLTYLITSAAKAGIGSTLSFDLLSITNATSTLGRLAAGCLADRYGMFIS